MSAHPVCGGLKQKAWHVDPSWVLRGLGLYQCVVVCGAESEGGSLRPLCAQDSCMALGEGGLLSVVTLPCFTGAQAPNRPSLGIPGCAGTVLALCWHASPAHSCLAVRAKTGMGSWEAAWALQQLLG